MRVIRWILSALFVLPILLNLTTIFDGGWIINAVLLAIATILVLPALDPAVNKKLAALRSKVLRIFLAVVLAIAALFISATPALTVQSIAVCAPDNAADCTNEMTVFAAGIQPVTVQTLLDDEDTTSIKEIAVDISQVNIGNKDDTDQDSNLFSKTFELEGKSKISLDIEEVVLDVGIYEVMVTPLNAEAEEGLAKKVTFVVLPSEEDVAKRTSSDNNFSKFKQTISELLVCPDPGGETHCETMLTTIPSDTPVLADAIMRDADANYSWLGKGPEITFTWREYASDENKIPEVILQDTIELGSNTGVFGYPLGIADKGLPPGRYDVVAVLETINSQPLRVPFTVTE